MAGKTKTVYTCVNCGAQFPRWNGQCRECGAWNTLEEETYTPSPAAAGKDREEPGEFTPAVKLSEIEEEKLFGERSRTGIGELDRALGGGIVRGSVALISGEPGIGKSTLLLQICRSMPDTRVLYVSGEESQLQIKMRAKRLRALTDNVYLQCETDIDGILAETDNIRPDLLIIDSVQTVKDNAVSSAPGSVSQVKAATAKIIAATKKGGFSTILVGHVNKDGVIAGPKLLEHMVDVVLYFEGERTQSCRILRAIKNRYGSTNEIGLFEMTDEGLEEVPDPSRRMMEDSPVGVPGSCPVCLMEGTRPILTEVQALVTRSPFPNPKRLASGLDLNRMTMMLAVLEKRLGVRFFDKDVYMNVVGGLRLDETAADLGVCAAILSCAMDLRLPPHFIAIGEVGLSGECRSVSDSDLRVNEAVRLGFEIILLPRRAAERIKKVPAGVKVIPVRGVFDLMSVLKEMRHDESGTAE
ncbi:MAG: DNA repair protein RadA [Clostridia bacterium]|nr:DNA repair protein RadA [Clostridia bacterium]